MLISDGAHHATGYGNVGRSLAYRLVRDGHEVACFGPGGLANGQFTYTYKGCSWEILSGCFGDARGGDDAYPYWRDWFHPDLIIPILDPCVFEYLGFDPIPVYFYSPIDTWPVNAQECGILGRADKVFVPSRWGSEVLKMSGVDNQYIPYGYESSEIYFSAENRKTFRDSLGITEDTFLIGMIGVHYKVPDRKGYTFAFEAISNFVRNHPGEDIKAYIKTELKTR